MKEINPAIEDMIGQKKLSEQKINRLIFLKKLVERVAKKPYLPDSEVEKIEKKFGVKPDIITWGDYFQVHTAYDHWEKDEQEFETIINTIYFDLIAAVMIFNGKPQNFFQDVESAFMEMTKQGHQKSMDDEEVDHLHILMTYYNEMGLKLAAFEQADFDFFREYSEERAVS